MRNTALGRERKRGKKEIYENIYIDIYIYIYGTTISVREEVYVAV